MTRVIMIVTWVCFGASSVMAQQPAADAKPIAAKPAGNAPSDQAAGAVTSGETAPDGEVPDTSVWMKKKMEYSQEILRGLAMADFEQIRFNAARLNVLNQVESFVRRKNPEYRTQLHTFNRVSAEIARQADKKNIEGATLAFNQLTVSCVQCHNTLREIGKDQDNP